MTPARFSECLTTIRWTEHILAAALECDLLLVEAWMDGEEDVPPKLAAWLEGLAQSHEAAESGKPVGLRGKKLGRPAD